MLAALRARLAAWRRRRRLRRITPAAARARVRRGAAYLDAVDPGWAERLDPDTLALADGRCCVLGQLHGDFRQGLGRARLLNLSSAPRASLSPVAYGFHCVQGVPEADQARDYALLDRAWHAALRARRPASSGAVVSDAVVSDAVAVPHPAAPNPAVPSAEDAAPSPPARRRASADVVPADRLV
jgi:hypothetical protein